MYFPRRAVSHVLEAPIAHPKDAARTLAVDRASEQVHRASMPDSVLSVAVRQWVRREVPAGERVRRMAISDPKPPAGQDKQETKITALTRF
jgi:hypothetical protein